MDDLAQLKARIKQIENQDKQKLLNSLRLFEDLKGYRTAVLITRDAEQSLMIGYFNWKQIKSISDRHGMGSEFVKALESVNPDTELLLITPGNPPFTMSGESWNGAVREMQQDLDQLNGDLN